MKIINFLVLIIVLMHLSTLINYTILDENGTGLLLMTNSILFLAAIVSYTSARLNSQKHKNT